MNDNTKSMPHSHLQYKYEDNLVKFSNETTYRAIMRAVDRHFSRGSTVLDVGCGRGEIMRLLSERGFSVHGCDMDPKCVSLSSQFGQTYLSSIDELVHLDISHNCDYIICSHVLEHLENPTQALRTLTSIAKKYVIVAVPNALSFNQIMRTLLRLSPRLVNPGHRCIWDWDHFLTMVTYGCDKAVLEWYSDGVFMPFPHGARKAILRLGLLYPLEEYVMPLLLPKYSRSIIAVISIN